MSISQSSNPDRSRGLIQGLLSSLAVLLSIGMCAILGIVIAVRIIWMQESLVSNADLLSLIAVIVAFGLVCLPSAILGWMQFRQKTVRLPNIQMWTLGGLILLAWLLCLVLGRFLPADSSLRALFFPVAHVGAVLFPILGILWFSLRGMKAHLPVRLTGLFNLALAISPLLSIVLELVLVVGFFIILVVFFLLNPGQAALLHEIAGQIQSFNMDTLQLEGLIAEYLRMPVVVILMLVFFSILVPLIEEAVKPVALLLFRRGLSREDGFVYGLICGAAFAFFETILAGLQTNQEEWLVVMLMRAGTGLLHMFTTGLVGFGIATAFENRSVLRIIKYYLISVIIHGVWNAMAILIGITQISPADIKGGWELIQKVGPVVLSLIVLGISLGLIRMKRLLAHPLVEVGLEPEGKD